MKIRNVSHLGASIAALLLAACGGGGGGSDNGGGQNLAPADKTPPTLTITPASNTVESGETLQFAITAQDARDGAVQWTLSCTHGTVTNAAFTAPQVDADTSVQCTVSATDAAGNAGTATASITVVPAPVLAPPTSETSLRGGQFGVLFASNLPLDQDTYEGTLDGEPITLVRQGTDTLLFGVPNHFSAGDKTLVVRIGARTFSQVVAVTPAPVIDDPMAAIEDVFQQAKASIQEILDDGAASLSAEQKTTLQNYLSDLDVGVSNLATMDPAQLQALAILLTSNGFDDTSFAAMSGNLKVNTAACTTASDTFLATHLLTLRAIGAVAAGSVAAYAALAPEVVFTKAVAAAIVGATVAYIYHSTKQLNGNLENLIDKCIVEVGVQLIAEIDAQFNKPRAHAIAYAPDTRYGFVNDEPRTFQIERSLRLHESVLGRIQLAFNRLVSAINTLPYIPSPARQLLENMKVESTEVVPASAVSLGAITGANITGNATASGDDLTLRFKAVDPKQENIDFAFKLTRVDEDPIDVLAQLTLDLPEAEDGALTAIQGRAKDGLLQVRAADSLELVTPPTLGSVLLQANGTFTYTPSGNNYGQDQFVYRARNKHGYSEPATVTVDVQRQFEGTWRVTATETISYESQPGLCPSSGTTTLMIGVTKVTDTLYQFSYSGYTMNLTMPSANSPGGLSGSISVTYDDGEDDLGSTTENLSIQIPNSNAIYGSNSWTYSGPEHTGCSGSVTYEGTRP